MVGALCFDAVHRYGAVVLLLVLPYLGCVLMQFIVMVQSSRSQSACDESCVLMQFIVMVQSPLILQPVKACCVLMQFIVMVQ